MKGFLCHERRLVKKACKHKTKKLHCKIKEKSTLARHYVGVTLVQMPFLQEKEGNIIFNKSGRNDT